MIKRIELSLAPKYRKDAGEEHAFDQNAVGLTVPTSLGAQRRLRDEVESDASDVVDIYDTTRPGHSNAGHSGDDFGTLLTEPEKTDLIEYLKTL